MISLKQNYRLSLIGVLYGAVFLLLALAVWNPTISNDGAAVDLMLILDESGSIHPRQNDALWKSFMQHGKTLPAGSRVSLIRFADRASVEIPWTAVEHTDFAKLMPLQQPPRQRQLDRSVTDILTAMNTALRQTSGNRPGAILISSDGVDTINPQHSALPLFTQKPELSWFYLASAIDNELAAIQIDSINLPQGVTPGQTLHFSIALKATRESQGSIEIKGNNRALHKQLLDLPAGAIEVLNLKMPVVRSGTQYLEIIVRDHEQNIIDELVRVVQARDHRQLLYIGKNAGDSLSLLRQVPGWKIKQLQPEQLADTESFFERFDVVLMDDLEAASLGPAATSNLSRAIRQSATALIVLGGAHSFGSGGYRHSELEKLLPVIAQASRPLPAAAFLFLLDKSGSMETSSSGSHSRLAHALRAVAESAKSIRPGDESAVLAFDREVQVLLPLKQRAELKSELDQPWQIRASGGTQLTPALREAVKLLSNSDSPQRFLILVTDGFVTIDNSEALKTSLRQANIRLVALTIGSDANPGTLRQLSAMSGGRLLHINDTAQLPRFMRQQLELTQQSWNDISVTPQLKLDLPFLDENRNRWQNLQGYQITRAKPAARVYLTTVQGDPLLAVGQYGAGRVAALPGGMLATISPRNLLQALLNWMNSRQHNPNLDVSYNYAAAQLTLIVDAVTPDNSWQRATEAQLVLTNPAGISQAHALEMIAPGRFSAVIQQPGVGIYTAHISVDNEHTETSLYLHNERERRYRVFAAWLQKAIDNGQIKPWTDASLSDLPNSSATRYDTRPWWLLLALLGYLGVMIAEHSSVFYWLKTGFPILGSGRKPGSTKLFPQQPDKPPRAGF